VSVRDVAKFVEMFPEVHLLKLNVEGEEYPVLERMLERGLLARVRDLQVQFHRTVPDCDLRYIGVRAGLERTHHLTYEYPWVWENWRRNS
jgi:hypothetical protein